MKQIVLGSLSIIVGIAFMLPAFILLDPALLSAVAIPAGVMIGLGVAMIVPL